VKRKSAEVHSSDGLEKSESPRTGTSVALIKQAILDNLYHIQGRIPELATRNDWYMAVAYAVRDRMLDSRNHEFSAGDLFSIIFCKLHFP
jgi:glycogen phosphorylase